MEGFVTHVDFRSPEGKAFMERLDKLDGLLWHGGDKPSQGLPNNDTWLYYNLERKWMIYDYASSNIEPGFSYLGNDEFHDELAKIFKPAVGDMCCLVNIKDDPDFLKSLDEFDGLWWSAGEKPSWFNPDDCSCFFLIFEADKKHLIYEAAYENPKKPIVTQAEFKERLAKIFPKKESPKKMTVAEVCKVLGYDVEIVKD